MKTIDMFKELEKNRKAKVKRLMSGSIFELSKGGTLLVVGGSPSTYNLSLDEEWELVQESVSFMTAVKAFNEGKIVSCEYESVIDGSIRRETFKPVGETNAMSRRDSLTFYVIEKGRWFIEQ